MGLHCSWCVLVMAPPIEMGGTINSVTELNIVHGGRGQREGAAAAVEEETEAKEETGAIASRNEEELLDKDVVKAAMDKRTTSKSGNFSDTIESNFNQGKVVLDPRNIVFNQEGSANMHDPQKLNHKPEASKHDNVGNARHNDTVPQPFSLATEERHGSTDEATTSKEKPGREDNSPLQPDMQGHQTVTGYCYSVAPVHAASVKTCKGRTTVATAPTFRCIERAEKRKEFYTKLEQKHQAMEAERMQSEARMREEQEEALKEFRKNLNFKANPVPRFYNEGPPPKVPPTHAKSPKFTQTKSFSKANLTEGNKYGGVCNRLHCHGICPTMEAMKRLPNSLKNIKSQSFKPKEEVKPFATVSTTNQMTDAVGVQT